LKERKKKERKKERSLRRTSQKTCPPSLFYEEHKKFRGRKAGSQGLVLTTHALLPLR
jgi:hypothetical protein